MKNFIENKNKNIGKKRVRIGKTDYRNFWKSVLESKLIDMLVMTPRWSKSQGAVIEYRTATTTNIEVIFIDGCKCEIKEVSL